MIKPTPEIFSPGRGKLTGGMGLIDLLPPSISYDRNMLNLAKSINQELEKFIEKIPSVLLWPAIGDIDEPLLTHLAFMLHVDWWDEKWTAAAKRLFLFRQILLHRRKGTVWAVEEAVSLVYGRAQVREWFEYGGSPGCFAVDLEVLETGLSQDNIAKIIMMISKYKRKSQHICRLTFGAGTSGTLFIGAATETSVLVDIYPYMPDQADLSGSTLYVTAAVEADYDIAI